MSYWDASALLKLYVREPDSPTFLAMLTQSTETIFSASIVDTEILCALVRKELSGDVPAGGASRLFEQFRAHVADGRITTVPYSSEVRSEAEQMVRRMARVSDVLRALDTIHLASAVQVRAKNLVSTDKRLRHIADRLGLTLMP